MSPSRHLFRRIVLPAVLGLLVPCLPARAADQRYAFDIPGGQARRWILELPVELPGMWVLEITWTGARPLTFVLEGPGGAPSLRRTGPSPQGFRFEVPGDVPLPETWRLRIRALPSGDTVRGEILVRPPEPPAPKPPPETARAGPAATDGPPPPWARAFDASAGDAAELAGRAETFRRWAVAEGGRLRPDACAWQRGLLETLAAWLGALERGEAWFEDPETPRLLGRIAEAVERVEAFRSSRDPMLAGPPPDDRRLRAAWERNRALQLRPLESALDRLLHDIHQGYAADVVELDWPARLVACVVTCQRHFEERGRVGAAHAAHAETASQQWEGILLAARVLEAAAALAGPGEDGVIRLP